MPFCVKRRAGLAKTVFGPGFECFGKFTLQIAVCLTPALLKCDVGTFAPDAILDGHLPIIFGVLLEPNFYLFLAFLRSWISQFHWGSCASRACLARTFLFIFGHAVSHGCTTLSSRSWSLPNRSLPWTHSWTTSEIAASSWLRPPPDWYLRRSSERYLANRSPSLPHSERYLANRSPSFRLLEAGHRSVYLKRDIVPFT